jgi:hypothetical protein
VFKIRIVSGSRLYNRRDVMSPCRSFCAAGVEPCLPKAFASGPDPLPTGARIFTADAVSMYKT